MCADCKLELPIEPLDLVQHDLILPLILLLGADRLSSHDLAAESLAAAEHVHGIGETRPGWRCDQSVEEHEVGSEPAMTGHVAIARRSRVVPAGGVGRMQTVPLFPRLLKPAFVRKHGEVDVAEVVGIAPRKRA